MNIYNKNNWHGISFNYSESVPYNKAKGITKFLFFGGIILLFAGVLLSFYSFFWGSIPVLTGVEMIAIMPLTMSNKARTLKIIIACVIPAGVILYLLIKFVFLDNPEMVKYFLGTSILLIIGICFLVAYAKENNRIDRCTYQLIGQVYDIQTNTMGTSISTSPDSSNPLMINTSNLTVGCWINGQWYTFHRAFGESFSAQTLQRCMQYGVPIRINPYDITEFVLADSTASPLFLSMGIEFLFLGILGFALCIILKAVVL